MDLATAGGIFLRAAFQDEDGRVERKGSSRGIGTLSYIFRVEGVCGPRMLFVGCISSSA